MRSSNSYRAARRNEHRAQRKVWGDIIWKPTFYGTAGKVRADGKPIIVIKGGPSTAPIRKNVSRNPKRRNNPGVYR